jgi:hypothetical protein
MPRDVSKNLNGAVPKEDYTKMVTKFELLGNVIKRRSRLVVGSRNPYALADILSHGETCGWKDRSFEKNQKNLTKYLKLPYHQLFDPVYGSCLFGPKIRKIIAECYENADEDKFKRKLLTGGPAIGTSVCQQDLSTWDLLAGGLWSYEDKLKSKVPSFDDPVQGPIPDCYYISALSSLAWAGKIKTKQTYNIGFYPNLTTTYSFGLSTNRPVPANPITLKLPLTQNLKPAGAKSKNPQEIWVPYYEKAYASYLEKIQMITPLNPATPDSPQICLIPEGDPCETLSLLTGQPFTVFPMISDSSMLLTQLQGLCQAYSGTASQKILVAALAYTYCTSDPKELAKLNPPVTLNPVPDCSAPADSGVLYCDDLLVASHTYSIFGIHAESGKNFVILRNPYGMNCALDRIHVPYELANGPLEFDSFTYPLFINNQVNNGIFALEINDFIKWFRGFCWVI